MEKSKPRSKKTRAENTAITTFINVQIFSVGCYIVVFLIFSLIALVADLPQKYDYYFGGTDIFYFMVFSSLTNAGAP